MIRGGKITSVTATALVIVLATPHGSVAGGTAFDLFESDVIMTAPRAPDRINVTQQDIELVVPVRERGPLGQATIIIGADDSIRIRAADLTGLLSRVITPAAVESLTALADARGYLTPDAVRTVGFDLTFDPGLLDLAVTIPLEARQRQTFDLGFDTSVPPPPVTDVQSTFAAYINYRASLDYLHRETGTREAGLQAPRFDLDVNGTIGRIAFENLLTIDPDADESFQRNASRLIFDQPDRAIRWTAGDLLPEGNSFQSASDIAGLSVARLYSLRPNDRFVTSRSSRSITLREPSTVDIRINGATVRTLQLQPGTYDLRDLPLTQGANAVEIVVEGPSGAREVIAFDFFSDTTLLAPGVDEFYFSGGIRAPRDFGGIDYRQDDPIVSGFYRRGINEQFTAGANIQATKDASLIGSELVYGGGWGLTAFELAVSNRDGQGSGYVGRVEHRMFRELETLPGRETIDFSLEVRSRDFAAIEQLGAVTNYAYQAAARYSRPLSRSLTASIGADYAKGRDQLRDRYGVSSFVNWRVNYETSVNFGATYNSNALNGEEANVFVNLTRRFGARRTVSVGAETRNGLVRAGYSRAPERSLNDWAYSVDVSRTDDAIGLNGAAVYIANRGEFEVNHATVFDNDGDIANQQTSLRAYGAVGYAGGRFGIGRRVFDSFGLVSAHPSLGRRPVLIRGVSSLEESARSGPLGPALVPLGSYYPQSVPYDVEDLPIGYDLGSGLFQLQPRLHSGYALTVGSAYYVTAGGIMLDDQGRPVSLRSGRAVSLDDPDAPKAEVVTNRQGRFAVSGLSAGRWRITLVGEPSLIYDIVVPDTTLYRAGEIRPTGTAGGSR
jgi:outer membrane usher protein